MPNDYHKPTEKELRDIFRPDDPKPIAPAPEEPMRVNVTTSIYYENNVGQAD